MLPQVLNDIGLVHADIKPENVLIREGESGTWPLLADYGYAAKLEAFDTLSALGPDEAVRVAGWTKSFSAPEVRQAWTSGERITATPRSDMSGAHYCLARTFL